MITIFVYAARRPLFSQYFDRFVAIFTLNRIDTHRVFGILYCSGGEAARSSKIQLFRSGIPTFYRPMGVKRSTFLVVCLSREDKTRF